MSEVTDLLDEIQRRLSGIGHPAADLLRPGVAEEEFTARIGPAPASVREWYGWRDGTARPAGQRVGDAWFTPGFSLPTLDEALHIRHLGHPDLDESGRWLPLLVDAGADLYAAVWDDRRFHGVVSVVMGAETETEFHTVEEMLRVHAAAYREGAFYRQGEWLEINDAAFDTLYRRITTREPPR